MKKLISLLLLLPIATTADVVVPIDEVQNSVNVRLEADASSDVVGELRRGESLPLVRSVEGWHEVRLEGDATGYVSADWSRVESDAAMEPADMPAESAAADESAPAADAEVAGEAEAETEPVAEAAAAPEQAAVEPVAEPEAPVEAAVEPEAPVEAAVEPEAPVEPEPEPAPVVETPPEPETPVEATPEPAPEPVVETPPEPEPAPTPGPEREPAYELKGDRDYVVKVRRPGALGNSQIFDDGNRVGIGTTEPQQRLEVNGSVQIHDQNSSVAGLIITQSSGDTGYIMHNRASTLTIGAGSIDRITVDRDGNVGIGVSRPQHPLEMASGAHVTAGGVWTNRSSRNSKTGIAALSGAEALAAVMALEPVSFEYRAEQGERYVGFIAEDLPSLLASSDGRSLSTMDIVAALTRVVQEQQIRIERLEAELAAR